MQDKKSTNRIWIPIATIILLGLLVILALDYIEVAATLHRLDLNRFALGAFFMIVGLFAISLRWRYLLGNELPFKGVFQADAISYMIRMFSPIPVSLLRINAVARITPETISQATPPMIADRLMETIMRLIMFVVATVLLAESKVAPRWVLLWVGFIALLVIGLSWLSGRVNQVLPRLSRLLENLPNMKKGSLDRPMLDIGKGLATVGTSRRMTTTLLLSVIMWGAFLVSLALIFTSMGLLTEHDSIAVSAAILVALPPSSPAMIGSYQAIMIALLLPFDIASKAELFIFSLLVFLIQLIFWLIMGFWGLRSNHLSLREMVSVAKNISSLPQQDTEKKEGGDEDE
jgi:uncharacterized membrane protein YbhN (UPF0104 family)